MNIIIIILIIILIIIIDKKTVKEDFTLLSPKTVNWVDNTKKLAMDVIKVNKKMFKYIYDNATVPVLKFSSKNPYVDMDERKINKLF